MDLWNPLDQLEATFYRRSSCSSTINGSQSDVNPSIGYTFQNHVLMGCNIWYLKKVLKPKDIGRYRLVLVQGTRKGRLKGMTLNMDSELRGSVHKETIDGIPGNSTKYMIEITGTGHECAVHMTWQLVTLSKLVYDHWMERLKKAKSFLDIAEASGEAEKLRVLAKQMREHVVIRPHLSRFRLHAKTFFSCHAIAHIAAAKACSSSQAIAIGNRLLNLGLIHHVTYEHLFTDQKLLYRFAQDQEEERAEGEGRGLLGHFRRSFPSLLAELPANELVSSQDVCSNSEIVEENHRLLRAYHTLQERVAALSATLQGHSDQPHASRLDQILSLAETAHKEFREEDSSPLCMGVGLGGLGGLGGLLCLSLFGQRSLLTTLSCLFCLSLVVGSSLWLWRERQLKEINYCIAQGKVVQLLGELSRDLGREMRSVVEREEESEESEMGEGEAGERKEGEDEVGGGRGEGGEKGEGREGDDSAPSSSSSSTTSAPTSSTLPWPTYPIHILPHPSSLPPSSPLYSVPHQPLDLTTTRVQRIDNDNFVGKVCLFFQHIEERRGEESVFRGKKRLFQSILQGQFKRAVGFREVLTGQAFSSALLSPPFPWLFTALSSLQPGLEVRVGGERPYLLSPLISTANHVAIHRPGEEPDISRGEVEEDLSLLGETLSSLSPSQRKRVFSRREELEGHCYDAGLVYTFDFYEHLFNFATFQLELGLLSYDVTRVLGPLPVQCMALVWPSPHSSPPRDWSYVYNFEVHHARQLEEKK